MRTRLFAFIVLAVLIAVPAVAPVSAQLLDPNNIVPPIGPGYPNAYQGPQYAQPKGVAPAPPAPALTQPQCPGGVMSGTDCVTPVPTAQPSPAPTQSTPAPAPTVDPRSQCGGIRFPSPTCPPLPTSTATCPPGGIRPCGVTATPTPPIPATPVVTPTATKTPKPPCLPVYANNTATEYDFSGGYCPQGETWSAD